MKERIAKLFAARVEKEGEKEKRAERVKDAPETRQVLGKSGRLLFSFCLWHRTGCVLTQQQQKDCRRGRR